MRPHSRFHRRSTRCSDVLSLSQLLLLVDPTVGALHAPLDNIRDVWCNDLAAPTYNSHPYTSIFRDRRFARGFVRSGIASRSLPRSSAKIGDVYAMMNLSLSMIASMILTQVKERRQDGYDNPAATVVRAALRASNDPAPPLAIDPGSFDQSTRIPSRRLCTFRWILGGGSTRAKGWQTTERKRRRWRTVSRVASM